MAREPWDGDDWGDEEETDLGEDLEDESEPPESVPPPPAPPPPAPGTPPSVRRLPVPGGARTPHTPHAPAAPSPSGRARRLKVKPMSATMRTRWPDVTSCLLTLTSGQQVIFVRG